MCHSFKNLAAFALSVLATVLAGCAAPQPCETCGAVAAREYDTVEIHVRHHARRLSSGQFACDSSLPFASLRAKARPEKLMQALLPPRLHSLTDNSQARRATILVGGIHDTYQYFDSWVAPLASADNLVLGWEHDHRATPMAISARLLAHDLADLRAAGIADITIVAHSIGGLVAKGAIDAITRDGRAHTFERLDLHAFGSPWGGFALLDVALRMPGSDAMSRTFGYPMAPELRPASGFLASLAQAMPGNGTLHMYVGMADHVALPLQSASRARHASAEAIAASLTTIDKLAHGDYSRATTLARLVRQVQARPCQTVQTAQTARCTPTLARPHCAEELALAPNH